MTQTDAGSEAQSASPELDHLAELRASVADFTRRGTSVARLRRLRGTLPGYEREVWRQLADMGWLAILVPEDCGGMGLGCAEMAIVAHGMARALMPEPLTASAVFAASAIAEGDNNALKQELLGALCAGNLIAAVAWQEEAGQLDPDNIAVSAAEHEGAYRLNGVKRFIAGAAGADGFLVSARTQDGPALIWIRAGTRGVTLDHQLLADGTYSGTLTLADVTASRGSVIASPATAISALQAAIDIALVIAASELLGVMSAALEMSLEYMKTRSQFGRKIGSFQALAHRAVDLYIQRELSSAVLDEVVMSLPDAAHAGRRGAMASRVKARCSDAALRITREAIQIHGAIGFTDEYDLGLYLKRALVLAAWLGNGAQHRRRYARLTSPADH